MRFTSKGQVTIPAEIREKLGLLPDNEAEFKVVGQAVRVRRVRKKPGKDAQVSIRFDRPKTRRRAAVCILPLPSPRRRDSGARQLG